MTAYVDGYMSNGFVEYGILTIKGDLFHDKTREEEEFNLANSLDPWSKDLYIQTSFFNSYILPLISNIEKSIGRKLSSILSAGCGTGVEVELLNKMGYDAYGFDPGSRYSAWRRRENCENKLVHCSSSNMPFKDNYFDLIICQQVIEHVGVFGDTMIPQPDISSIRREFCQSLLSKVRSGGFIQIATPNRHFPLDPGHAPNFLGVRIHGPFEKFLVSYRDMSHYFAPHMCTPLGPYGYYTGSKLTEGTVLGTMFQKYCTLISKFDLLKSSPLNPLCCVLAHKS